MRHARVSLLLAVCITALLISACNLSATPLETPVPTPDVPRVEFAAPPNNTRVLEGTEFDIDLIARDESQGVARVELFVDDTKINEASPQIADSVPVFTVRMNWRAEGVGFHILEAVAYRQDGTRGDSVVINVEVLPRD